MKKFLNRVLRFSVFSVCAFLFIYVVINIIYIYRLNNLKLDENIDTLVLGDSQSQTAVNDSLYSNLINFSHNSEHYVLTYNVLELVLKHNPQIKNVILGCTYHNISSFYDRCLFNEENKAEPISRMLCSRYFSMLDIGDKLMLLENNSAGILKSLRVIVLNMISSITDRYSNYQDYHFIGKYYPGIKRVLNDTLIKGTILWHFYKDSTGAELESFSQLQKEYLEKIIMFCNERNINLVLLNTPLHKTYYEQVPEKFISGFYSYMKELEDKYKVILYDYPEKKYPDEYFGDGNHLNRKGASVFTQEIMSRLNNN